MGGSGDHRRLPGGSDHFSWHTDTQTLHHNIYMVNIIIRSPPSRQRFWPSWRRWTGSQYVLGQYLVMWYEEALFNHGCQIKQVSDPYDHPRSSSSSSSTLRSATWWTSWFLGSATTGQIPCGKDCNCWGTSRLRYILKYLQNYENIQIFENISSVITRPNWAR